MDYSELIAAVSAHKRAARELEESRIAVWNALVNTEPELASELLQLFSTVEAAALWATSSTDAFNDWPAQQVVNGRAAVVLSRVRKTAHGFVG